MLWYQTQLVTKPINTANTTKYLVSFRKFQLATLLFSFVTRFLKGFLAVDVVFSVDLVVLLKPRYLIRPNTLLLMHVILTVLERFCENMLKSLC